MSQAIETLARTIYGEARGEYAHPSGGLAALIAVGNVVVNRVNLRCWYGKNVEEVCQKPFQFSCWNKSDPNYALLTRQHLHNDPIFRLCEEVAEGVLSKQWPDLTRGADHYHSVSMPKRPTWAKGKQISAQIGRHIFYKLHS